MTPETYSNRSARPPTRNVTETFEVVMRVAGADPDGNLDRIEGLVSPAVVMFLTLPDTTAQQESSAR